MSNINVISICSFYAMEYMDTDSYFILEWLYDGCCAASTIDQNQSQASACMSQTESCQNISASTFTQANDVFDVQKVQNGNQIFSQSFQRWKLETIDWYKNSITPNNQRLQWTKIN